MLMDRFILSTMQVVLATFLVIALFQSALANWRRSSGTLSAAVKRGDRSMTVLYVAFGIITVLYTLAIQVSVAAIGYKVGLRSVSTILRH